LKSFSASWLNGKVIDYLLSTIYYFSIVSILCRKHQARVRHCERKKPLALSEQKLALSAAEWVEGEAISNAMMALSY